jgi:polyisoprenoid-binding protein YceI
MKKFLAWIGAAGAAAVLVGLAVFVLMPEREDEAKSLSKAGAGEARAVEQVKAESGDRTFALGPGNTTVDFSCAKTLAGKTLSVQGGWSGELNSRLSGELVAAADGSVKSIRVEIDMRSVWSEHDMLTDALLRRGFFLVDQAPTSTFVSTSIRAGGVTNAALSNATHTVEGNFKLNGIEKSIAFPAAIEVAADRATLRSAFSLDRKVFNCNFVDTAGLGLLTDENIATEVALKVKVDARLGGGAEAATAAVEEEEKLAPPLSPAEASALPAAFAETIPATQVRFDMILVPGDAAAGLAPYYIGKREVTWDEFAPWMTCRDVPDTDQHGVLRAKKLRPSMSYIDVTRGYGSSGFPALSMSRLSAELYCKWLSAQTGRRYRLPTEEEWNRAWVLGGRSPDKPLASAGEAEAVAVFEGNSFDDFDGKYKSRAAGSKAPNKLGIHDMAGNVAEWVVTPGEQRVIRGGHYSSTFDQLGGAGRLVESREWNINYPNEPKSIWWFVDAEWVGIRLVCEPAGGFKAP